MVVLGVLQAPGTGFAVKASRCFVDGPAALVPVVLAAFDVAAELRVCRQSSGHGLGQVQLLDVLGLNENDDAHVDSAGPGPARQEPERCCSSRPACHVRLCALAASL